MSQFGIGIAPLAVNPSQRNASYTILYCIVLHCVSFDSCPPFLLYFYLFLSLCVALFVVLALVFLPRLNSAAYTCRAAVFLA